MSRNPQTVAPLYSELADDADMLAIVEQFVARLPQRVDAFRTALAANDLENLRELAHQLKGAGGGYGFLPISELAACVERSVVAGDEVEKIHQQIEELAALCQRATADVPRAR